MTNKKLADKSTYFCNKCMVGFNRTDNLTRHQNSENGCIVESKVVPKQKIYGMPSDIPSELLEADLINEEHVNFRQEYYCSWDIETLEEELTNENREKAILGLVSISAMSSSDAKPTCFVREGDTTEHIRDLVDKFLSFLEIKTLEFEEKTPKKFYESLKFIAETESRRREEQKAAREAGIPYKLV